jgi:hypothetical protein
MLRDRHAQIVMARCTAEQNTGEDIHIIKRAACLLIAVKRGFIRCVKI